MFWKDWSWSARTLSVIGVPLVGAILFPVFVRQHEPTRSNCQSNLKQIGLGFLQYAQDYDEKFPAVTGKGDSYGWADAIQPYIKSTNLYQCSGEPTKATQNPDPRKSGYSDYPFNKRMDNIAQTEIEKSAQQVIMLDGNFEGDITDARYSFAQIPDKWQWTPESPLFRHRGRANYLFADGHAKGLLPGQVEVPNRLRAVF